MKLRGWRSKACPVFYGAERNPAPKIIHTNLYSPMESTIFWCADKK